MLAGVCTPGTNIASRSVHRFILNVLQKHGSGTLDLLGRLDSRPAAEEEKGFRLPLYCIPQILRHPPPDLARSHSHPSSPALHPMIHSPSACTLPSPMHALMPALHSTTANSNELHAFCIIQRISDTDTRSQALQRLDSRLRT